MALSAPSERLAKRVLLIGWDAADWKLIDKFIDEGAMPFLQGFLERGSSGNLATLQPVLSPMLWNSIATGKRPYKHGIYGFTEPMPDGKGVRPSSSTTRTCKALWNIVTQRGMTANVVSWFCGHPAEPINGICVTEMFQKLGMRKDDTSMSADHWPLPPDCVHPESLREALAELRVHPTELSAEEILPFIPNAAKIDQDKDRRLTVFAKLMAEMVSVHNAATWVIEQNDWDFMGVYLDSIDHFGHAFMTYHPPRMENVAEDDFEIYSSVMKGWYRFHDLMLGRLLQQAGVDTTVVLCSDHGFHCDHLRPTFMPRQPAGPAIWHRDYGIVAMAGPGTRSGERIYGARVLDIAPTVLLLLGLPAAADMDGKPLLGAIDRPLLPRQIPSWEDVDGDAGMHPPDKRDDPFAAREAIRQLVALGYIEEPDENEEKAAADAAREARFNLARAYLDGDQLDEAERLLAELWRDHPDTVRLGVQLTRVHMAHKRYDEVRETAHQLLATLKKLQEAHIQWAQNQARHIEQNRDELVEQARRRCWDEAYDKAVAAEAKKAEEEGREPIEIRRTTSPVDETVLDQRRGRLEQAAERMRGFSVADIPQVNMMLGQLALIDRNFQEAIRFLDKAEKAEPRLPGLHLRLGQTYLRMRRNGGAVRAFQKALDIDGDNALAHEGLATALTRVHRFEEATDHALSAVELRHEMPRAHLRLGVTLVRLRMFEQAAEAFQTCLKLATMTPIAHRWLAALYRSRLDQPDLAHEHLKMAIDMRYARDTGLAPSRQS